MFQRENMNRITARNTCFTCHKASEHAATGRFPNRSRLQCALLFFLFRFKGFANTHNINCLFRSVNWIVQKLLELFLSWTIFASFSFIILTLLWLGLAIARSLFRSFFDFEFLLFLQLHSFAPCSTSFFCHFFNFTLSFSLIRFHSIAYFWYLCQFKTHKTENNNEICMFFFLPVNSLPDRDKQTIKMRTLFVLFGGSTTHNNNKILALYFFISVVLIAKVSERMNATHYVRQRREKIFVQPDSFANFRP